MTTKTYDAIVVGARVAGSPIAMLLARKGYEVLLLDRATFPSDTISTHLVHPPGIDALSRWGLVDSVVATGCPPIDTYAFDFGPFTISGSPAGNGARVAYAPRRTVLDRLLLQAAADAGVDVRQGFSVETLVSENGRITGVCGHDKGGATITEHARVVIGADGRHSLVAHTVSPDQYHEKPPLLAAYYAYWSGLPMDGRFETYIRPSRGMAAWPTNDDLTVVIAGWPYAEFEANKKDIEGNFLKTYDLAPSFAQRLRDGTRETRFVGTAVSNYLRKPYGPGWALVGDAGYNKDFITAQGIHDAFRDAELCATALDEMFRGGRSFDAAMADYQTARDRQVLPMYEFTTELATLEPPPPELLELLVAMPGNQDAMDGFARVNAGVTSPAEFFSPQNVERIMSQSEAVSAVH
jgi:2-polyprenyl-6-methoxyphenol hydroxylase-like FAD-dependent oxidoreductase